MFVITANWQRIKQIDLLRGSAILAILLINIFGFALPQLAYVNPVYLLARRPAIFGAGCIYIYLFRENFWQFLVCYLVQA
ncbi:MAG TPA: hypothetical protein ACHBY5_04570 [Arsenophonus apicola]|uniref:hypothetical protein n=1 Tax=Arsenophonus endosymbiont of Apis mellifera TaxID=1541805 RepID=UPI001F34CE6D|nr:hypothetical protein [Arsenophonus endosymbiont of Apis mellifera]